MSSFITKVGQQRWMNAGNDSSLFHQIGAESVFVLCDFSCVFLNLFYRGAFNSFFEGKGSIDAEILFPFFSRNIPKDRNSHKPWPSL